MLANNPSSGGPDRSENRSSCDLVRRALMLLAAKSDSLSPDDLPCLEDDLLDWATLVKVDFVQEWSESAERLLGPEYTLPVDHIEGQARKMMLREANLLATMVDNARNGDQIGIDRLACAAIMLAELIGDRIRESNPKLALALTAQVNSLYNEGVSKVMKKMREDASADSPGADDPVKIAVVCPVTPVNAPELEDKVDGEM